MAPSTEPEVEAPKDLLLSQATSPIEMGTQVLPTTGLVVKLASPLAPSDQAEGEKWYMLVVTASVMRLNFGSNWNYPRRHSDCLSSGSGL